MCWVATPQVFTLGGIPPDVTSPCPALTVYQRLARRVLEVRLFFLGFLRLYLGLEFWGAM
jgi:hypothetical protein